MTMKIRAGYIMQEMDGQAMVFRTGDAFGQGGALIELNETGVTLWRALERGATLEGLTQALTDAYDVAPDKAAADAARFADGLRKAGILED